MKNIKFENSTLITTPYGKIEGLKTQNNILSWLGIPYAKPPIGTRRWKAPEIPEKWVGVLNTKSYASSSIQNPGGVVTGNEDCLYLNIWRPNTDETNLPVLVFAHGGANRFNSGQFFNGDPVANELNSVVVSINYRLGPMGWFRHPILKTGNSLDDSGNYGLLDIIHSLKWVKECISSFGGNPNNVTLGGQSGGGRDVLASLISPLAKNLYQKAWASSSGLTLCDAKKGDEKSEEVILNLFIKDGLAPNLKEAKELLYKQSTEITKVYLLNKEATEFLPLYEAIPLSMSAFPHLFTDGHVLPKEGWNAINNGDYHNVPLLLGCTETEMSVFTLIDPSFRDKNNQLDSSKLGFLDIINTYGSKLYSHFNLENVAESLFTNEKNTSNIYCYRVNWGQNKNIVKYPANILFGAAHEIDINLITGKKGSIGYTLYNVLFPKTYYLPENKGGRNELSSKMIKYLKNFLYNGDPNSNPLPSWANWTSNEVIIFDADNKTAHIAMSDTCYTKEQLLNIINKELKSTDREKLYQYIGDRFFYTKEEI